MLNEYLFFGGFLLFIVLMLSIDLGVFNKKDHIVSLTQAGVMSAIWVSLAAGFYLLLIAEGQELHGIGDLPTLTEIVKKHQHNVSITGNFAESIRSYKLALGLEFLTGYLIEYALSVDNIFVMVLIFNAFNVNEKYYHRVLFWGIIGALVMRFGFIFLGAQLITRFGWIIYLFGAFLVYTGVMMFVNRNQKDEIDSENHPVVRFAARYFRVVPDFHGKNFFVRLKGQRFVTPLFVVLLMVEATDLLFAVDSIPAIFSVTKDPYIVFFSNIFAILGLRSMFFLLVNIIHKFRYLKTGLAFLLVFIGIKMLAHHWLEAWGFTTMHSLLVILLILTTSIVASLAIPERRRHS